MNDINKLMGYVNALIEIPGDTVEMKIECTVWNDGYPNRVERFYSMPEVRDTIYNAKEETDSSVYRITEKELEYMRTYDPNEDYERYGAECAIRESMRNHEE